MDVHSKNYTLCAMEPVIGEEDRIFANIQVTADYKNILMFIEQLKMKLGMYDEYDIQCGYEAGCLGYSLYNQLTSAGVKCVILAPTTMLTQQGKRVKTDARDALMIAQCLSYGGYHAVYIPTEKDDSVKEYLRMRDDHKDALKKTVPYKHLTLPTILRVIILDDDVQLKKKKKQKKENKMHQMKNQAQ